jgi:small subunit ribosomal protein S21
MLIVKVENNNIEKALKIFKNKVRKTGQTQKLRENKEFEKPSVTNRKSLQKAKYIQNLKDSDQEL